jgi:DNA processing protein
MADSEFDVSDIELTMARLDNLSDKPSNLLYKGSNPDILWERETVGIVGSRVISEESFQAAFNLGATMAKNNCVVVSGLANGIDTAAFEGAVSESGCCVVVLPSGLDEVVPKTNIGLVGRIIENGGCVISEYPNGTKPQKWRFLARNRIIAALSDKVIIGEAREGGGAWNTVEHAWKLQKATFKLELDGELTQIYNPQRRL